MHKHLKFVSTVGMSREEWVRRRRGSIGGSDAAAVVGLNQYVSQYSLWAEKTGRVPGFEGNLATEVGTYMEEFVARKFSEVTGKKVRRCNNIIYNPDYPFAHVNIDRDVVGEPAGLECKTTDSLNMKKFKNGEYPAHYYCQCVHSMAVTGAERWYLAVLIGNREFRWFVIERDEDEIAALMDAEKMFWYMVEKNVTPMADGSPATTAALGRLYPEGNDTECSLFGYEDDAARYLSVCQQIKALETMRDELANNIKSHMGTTSVATGSQHKVTWRTQSRATFDHKRFAAENPDVDLSGYFKTSTSRVFRVVSTTEKEAS